MSTILAWHFLADDGMTRFEPRVKVEPGKVLTVEPPLAMCWKGLHASIRAIDALTYAPGAMVCRVECSGEIQTCEDKLCCQHRKCIWMARADRVMHELGCDLAEQALMRVRAAGQEPERTLWDTITVKRKWINGEATSQELEMACLTTNAAIDYELPEPGGLALSYASRAAFWTAGKNVANSLFMISRYAADSASWLPGKPDRVLAWKTTMAEQNSKFEAALQSLQER